MSMGVRGFCFALLAVLSYPTVGDYACADHGTAALDAEVGEVCAAPPNAIALVIHELAGTYYWFEEFRSTTFTLGFSLSRVDGVCVSWSGLIGTGLYECRGGGTGGWAGGFLARLGDESVVEARTRFFFDFRPDVDIPFDEVSPFQTEGQGAFDFLLDGSSVLNVAFPGVLQECFLLEPGRGVLDQITLWINGRRLHDSDGDVDVDLFDASDFGTCMDGPNEAPGPSCAVFDADRDADIDLRDAASLLREFSG